MSKAEEILYGEPAEFTAPCDLAEGDPVEVDGRVGIATAAVKAGVRGSMFDWGPFYFRCAADLSFAECDKVAYDPASRQICRVGTPGSFILGSALLPCKPGDCFLMVQLNG